MAMARSTGLKILNALMGVINNDNSIRSNQRDISRREADTR